LREVNGAAKKAARIVGDLGAKILTPEEARQKLKLKKHF